MLCVGLLFLFFFFKQANDLVVELAQDIGSCFGRLLTGGGRHVLCLCPYVARSGLLPASSVSATAIQNLNCHHLPPPETKV